MEYWAPGWSRARGLTGQEVARQVLAYPSWMSADDVAADLEARYPAASE